MPLERTEARVKLVEEISKALREAERAGIGNPLELLTEA